MTQKVWRKAKALAAEAAATPYNQGAYGTTKPSDALPPGMRKGVVKPGEAYTKRRRSKDEALPPTHVGSGRYRPGDGETPIFYRPGAFDHQRHKSRGIGV